LTSANLTFRRLTIEGWRQFEAVDIDLHPTLTVITGANGSGKSTLLNIFSQHFGSSRPYLATPKRVSGGSYRYLVGLFESIWRRTPSHITQIGSLQYSNGTTVQLNLSDNQSVQYNLSFTQQAVFGFHVGSHRVLPVYRLVGQIQTQPILPEQAYGLVQSETNAHYTGQHTGFSPTYRIKEALISMATFGQGNQYVQGNSVVLNSFLGFIEALRKILPESLGFLDISIRIPDVVLITKSGEFLIDAASGGIMALIDLAWQIYMYSLGKSEFVVTIDEPENHLHPSMQRSLMRNLIQAFPQVQFIIATHSPFMVSSVRDSNVYILDYRRQPTIEQSSNIEPQALDPSQTQRVTSTKLDTVNRAGSAGEILREVLGVPATIPVWVEENLEQIVMRYRARQLTTEMLGTLRTELSNLGYGELYPEALAALTRGK